jgi:hypothetical protein
MPVKNYPVIEALLRIQPGRSLAVRNNSTDQIEWGDWVLPYATEAEIDAAGADYMANKADIEAERELLRDRFIRTIFEINFDQENRIRTLEGNSPVTKSQYKTALVNLYKSTT